MSLSDLATVNDTFMTQPDRKLGKFRLANGPHSLLSIWGVCFSKLVVKSKCVKEKSFIFDTDLGLSEDFGDNLLKVTVAWSSLAAITFD